MHDPGRRIPARPELNPVRAGELRDPDILLLVIHKTLADLFLRAVGVEAEIRHRHGAGVVIILRRIVIRLWLAEHADLRRGLEVQMQVVEQRHIVVEELRVHRPGAVLVHHIPPDELCAELLDGFLERELLLRRRAVGNVAQSLVRAGQRTVVAVDDAREPALFNCTALRAKSVVIVRMQA